jgi:predicted enzyme related to lactoylglutathione lyase
MTHAINWFEIPVADYKRAKQFYENVIGKSITDMPMDGVEYGILPHDDINQGVGGGLIKSEHSKPSQDGVTVYLNGGDDLSAPLSRVEDAGGKVIIPKTAIGDHGFMAQFIDSEGNKIALHSLN